MAKPVNRKLYLAGKQVDNNPQIVEIYRERIKRFGMSGKSMFYQNESQHQTKVAQFAILLHSLIRPGDTLLDIGCGYGSLVPLLPSCHYTGIDIVPEFISSAKERYDLGEFKVLALEECQDVYDWCVLLGVVNSIVDPDKLLELTWRKCRRGMLVDFIDDKKMTNKNELNRFDMGDCLAGLLHLGARTVEVHPTDTVWTIFVACKVGKWLKARSG